MLSYQHIYHAGNLADVHKHYVLAEVLAQMPAKSVYLDTNAARGVYDLGASEAEKTGEAQEGIVKLYDKLPDGHPYKNAIDKARQQFGENAYPGSPFIAKTVLGLSNLHLCELHPQEFAALAKNMQGAKVYNEDGYGKVLKLAAPKLKSGLVLIDPSYEVKTEYALVKELVLKLHRKWPEVVILLWYPVLTEGYHKEFEGLGSWQHEFMFPEPTRMLGSGLVGVNLPEVVTPDYLA